MVNLVLIAFVLVIFLTAGLTWASGKLYRMLRVRGKVYVAAWDEDSGNIHIGLYSRQGNRIEVPGNEKTGTSGKVYLLAARGRKTVSGELAGTIYPIAPRYGHNLTLPRSGELVESKPQRADATYAQMVSVDAAEVTAQPRDAKEAQCMSEVLAREAESFEEGKKVFVSLVAPSDAELHRSSKQWRMLGVADPASLRHAIYHNEAQDALHHNKPKKEAPTWVTIAIVMGGLFLIGLLIVVALSVKGANDSAAAARAAAAAGAAGAPVVKGALLAFGPLGDRFKKWWSAPPASKRSDLIIPVVLVLALVFGWGFVFGGETAAHMGSEAWSAAMKNATDERSYGDSPAPLIANVFPLAISIAGVFALVGFAFFIVHAKRMHAKDAQEAKLGEELRR